MKQIISSKGKFNITDSLYESIKKNNPELLMEDDSSFNVFAAYDGKVNDIINKLRLNNNEIDDLKKRIKSYENSVKDSFGTNHSDEAYKICDFYLDNLYKSANGSKDNFLKNLSSKYDPDVITKMINKNKPKTNNDMSPTDEEILDTISSSTNIPVNELSDEQKEELISTYDDEVDKSNGKNDNAWNEVGKKAEELYNDKKGNKRGSFEDYIKSYDGYDAPEIDFYIKDLLSEFIPNKQYVDEATNRYMNSFDIQYSDTLEISDEEVLKRTKDDMIKLYNKVANDCYKLKEIITKAKKEINKNKINESKEDDIIENNIYKYFAKKGIKFVENNLGKILHGNIMADNEDVNVKSSYNINDEGIKKRVKDLQSSYITNDTIDFLKELYNIYVKNDVDDENMTPKMKCIKNVYKAIENGYDRLNTFLKNSSNEKEKNEIKDRIAYIIRKTILGVNNENFAPIDDFDEKLFEEWYDENAIDLAGYNDLLKHLTNDEWKKFADTLDYPESSSVKTSPESANKFVKKIIDIVKTETFDTKIPGVILNYVKSIDDKISGKIIKSIPFLKFYNFGTKKLPFLNDRIKTLYIDLTKNEGEIYRDIKLHDVYRSIPVDEFWKNACVFHCWTHEAFGIVLSAMSEMGVRDDMRVYRNIITTGLPASTQIFSLSPTVNNDDGRYESRNGSQLFVDKTINDKKIIDKINRKYFIVVTEGIIRKGKLINNIYQGAKNLFKNSSKGNNFFGIDTSDTRLK